MKNTTLIAVIICMLTAFSGPIKAADPVIPIPYSDVPVPPVEQRGIWGAIAFSSQDGFHGFFWGADKKAEAAEEALKHCRNEGGKGCEVVQVFRNHRHWTDDDRSGFPYKHCGALAVDASRSTKFVWGAASASTRGEAINDALAQCIGEGKECRIREWVCT